MLEEDLEEHIARYYDTYYDMAEGFAKEYSDHVVIFETTDLNSTEGRSRLLEFCLPNRNHLDFEVHDNSNH